MYKTQSQGFGWNMGLRCWIMDMREMMNGGQMRDGAEVMDGGGMTNISKMTGRGKITDGGGWGG